MDVGGYVGLILFFIGLFLLIACAVLRYHGDNVVFWPKKLVGIILLLGGFISMFLGIAGVILMTQFSRCEDPYVGEGRNLFIFFSVILCAFAIAEFVWGIRYLKSVPEERCRLKNHISELTNEQEEILDRWKRSAYCARPNGKAEPKNETETSDEDADKK